MRRLLILGSLFCLLNTTNAWAQFTVENPTASTTQSGISVVSGWICNASKVEVVIDNFGGVQIPYGVPRPDAQSACAGKLNTGFGGLINWNELGDGLHAVKIIADGQQIANIPVTVVTLGTNFLRGESRIITSWFAGCRVALVWRESQQNFVIGQTDACFRPLLGRWEFVLSGSAEKDHYAFERIEVRRLSGTTELIESIIGTDLDHGGEVQLVRTSDLDVSTPYTFYAASIFSSHCEVFLFNQTGPNTVQGLGLSYPADPFSGCFYDPTPTPVTYPMTGTRTGVALSTQEAVELLPPPFLPGDPSGTTISRELLAELLEKTVQLVPR